MSVIEGNKRCVTIDELFGLAINFGVTVGHLLDPSGPDGGRDLRLDVGLGPAAQSTPLPTRLAGLFAASRAVIRLVEEDSGMIEIDLVDAEAVSPQELEQLGAGVGVPVRKRLSSSSGA